MSWDGVNPVSQDLLHPNSWQTPVAAVTVDSAPDYGR